MMELVLVQIQKSFSTCGVFEKDCFLLIGQISMLYTSSSLPDELSV